MSTPTLQERMEGCSPCRMKLLETETIFAFMDIGPIAKGHCLVIPKCKSPILALCSKNLVSVEETPVYPGRCSRLDLHRLSLSLELMMTLCDDADLRPRREANRPA